ncbi:hypothetical protein ABH922_001750 [Rhodococcus sp. 27YEA15]
MDERQRISVRAPVPSTAARTSPGDFWAVILNDVAPDARPTVLTDGALTSSLRAVDDTISTRAPNGDYVDVYALCLPRYFPLGAMRADSGLRPQHLHLGPGAPSFVTAPFVEP